MIYIDRIEVVNKLAPYAGISHPVSTSSTVTAFAHPVAALSWFARLNSPLSCCSYGSQYCSAWFPACACRLSKEP